MRTGITRFCIYHFGDGWLFLVRLDFAPFGVIADVAD